MNSEITKEAYRAILNNSRTDNELLIIDFEKNDLFQKEVYEANGVILIEILNYTSKVTQYYVQDINA